VGNPRRQKTGFREFIPPINGLRQDHRWLCLFKKIIYIDDSSLISGKYTGNFLMVPKKPLILKKDGSIQTKE